MLDTRGKTGRLTIRLATRTARVTSTTVVTVAATAGVAFAADQTMHYNGLLVSSGGTVVGEIDTTTNANNLFQKLVTDPNGDRMHVQAPIRDRAAGNGKSVYTQVDWAKNSSYCYVSGLGVGDGGGSASTSCSDGWNGYGSSRGSNMQDSNWWFYGFDKAFDLQSNSIRAALKICQDVSWASDPCSGQRFGGVSY